MSRLAGLLDSRLRLFAAAAIVAALHLAFALAWPSKPLASDALGYHLLASSLADGKGYGIDGAPETAFMPGYPLFLAGIYRVARTPVAVWFAQALLAAVAAALVCRFTQRSFGPRAGVCAFFLMGALPALFVYPGTLNAETLVIALISLFLFAVGRPPPTTTRGLGAWSAVAGMICGALALTKPEFFLWMPVPAVICLATRQGARRTVLALASAGLLFGLLLTPWAMRNRAVLGKVVPFSTSGGRAFWLSAHRPELTEYQSGEFQAAAIRCNVPNDPVASDRCLFREAADAIADHPSYYAWRTLVRSVRMFVGSHTEELVGYQESFVTAARNRRWQVVAVKGALLAIQLAFVTAGLIGLLLLSRGRQWAFLAYMVLTKVAVHALLFSTPRYSLHLAPLLCATAAWWLVNRGAERAGVPPPPLS